MSEPLQLPCDFDGVMSPAQQVRWVAEVDWRDRDGLRVDDPDLRGRHAPRAEQLRAMVVWADVAAVLQRYVRAAIPAPRRSERAFWACACLPDSDEAMVLARVDVGPADVCTVTADDELTFSFRLGLDPLDLPRFATRAGLSVADLRSRPAGDIEVVLSAVGAAAALGLFDDEVIVRGMRRFNLDLARRGPCDTADWHSLALADVLLAESDAPAAPAPDDAAYREPSIPGSPDTSDAPRIDDALAEVDRLLADGHYDEAREALTVALARRGAQAVNDVDPAEGTSLHDRAAYALREIADAIADDDPAVLAWVPRAKLLRAESAGAVLKHLLVLAGRFHRRGGRPARGIEFVARALGHFEERHASITLLLVELARCYTALGDLDAAQTHLGVALRHASVEGAHSTRLAVRGALAERHLRAGDPAAAREDLLSALGLAREHHHLAVCLHLLAPLAWCEERLGFTDEAVSRYAEALALLDGSSPPGLLRGVLAGLVRCHDRRDDTTTADAYLRRAELMTERAWPDEGLWPCESLLDACLVARTPPSHDLPSE